MTQPAFTIDVRNELGEGPVWDDRIGRLWWTDILASRLYYWDWDSKKAGFVELPEQLGCLGLTTDPAKLVCAFATGFAILTPASGNVDWLARPVAPNSGIRFNDGRVDRAGRFFAGTLVEDADKAGEDASGTVYRLDQDGTASELFGGVEVTNGICFSPDNTVMYFADSPKQKIFGFALLADGTVSERQVFHKLTTGGYPDGAEVDSEGRMWSAEWDGHRVTAYNSDKSIAETLMVPVTRPTCTAFGGPDMRHLFVTTARAALDEEVLAAEPMAGKVLVYEGLADGLLAPRFPLQGLG